MPALIILIREFMISGLREYLAKQNISAPVTTLAKWKTTAQILALGFLMGAPGFPGFPFAHEIGLTLLWIAAILTIHTGSAYVKVHFVMWSAFARYWHLHSQLRTGKLACWRPNIVPISTNVKIYILEARNVYCGDHQGL